MIIKNSMLGWSAGWWLDSCTQHQDNDKLWTSGGLQCKYGGAKTGPMVITPAIFSLLFSPHILMKMMKEDKDALCESTWTRSRNYELVSVYLDLSGVWINLRYPLYVVAAGTCDDIDGCACQHSATKFIPPPPHTCVCLPS